MEMLRLRLSQRPMKRGLNNALIGKWVDSKFDKKKVKTILPEAGSQPLSRRKKLLSGHLPEKYERYYPISTRRETSYS
jgi:hypothetical protein